MRPCSVVITTYKDQEHILRLLNELDQQIFDKPTKLSIFHCESGEEERHFFKFSNQSINYQWIYKPNFGRTAALNLLFKLCIDDLIIRLDARTHIDKFYINDIINLLEQKQSSVVAGVMVPIGRTKTQVNNALLMKNRIVFGGGRFKDETFCGYTNSVYLGAFNMKQMPIPLEYDENSKISEDSEFYYRLICSGGTIWQSNKIKAKYFAREKFVDIILLAKNYGEARALYILKHKKFGSFRQIIPLAYYLLLTCLILVGSFKDTYMQLAGMVFFIYIIVIWLHFYKNNLKDTCYLISTTVLIHFTWTMNLFFVYIKKKLLSTK